MRAARKPGRRLAGVPLLAVPLVLGLLLAAPAAQAEGAQAQGWWSAAHRTALPAPPGPPDVAADDLLLQGGDPARLLPAGVSGQSPSPSAYAALRFVVPLGGSVAGLTLPVAAGGQAADVRAYPTRAAWLPAQGGAIEAAPAPELSRYSQGALTADGLSLVFRDIGRLVDDTGLLSVVLVPGPADRVVVHHPPGTALVVAPAPAAGAPSDKTLRAQPAQPVTAPAGQAAGFLPTQSYVAAPGLVTAPAAPPPPVSAPVTAPAAASVAATVSRQALVSRLVADDARTRVLVGLEALLVLVMFGLVGQGPLRALARSTGQQPATNTARGVGRFRTARVGPPPTL